MKSRIIESATERLERTFERRIKQHKRGLMSVREIVLDIVTDCLLTRDIQAGASFLRTIPPPFLSELCDWFIEQRKRNYDWCPVIVGRLKPLDKAEISVLLRELDNNLFLTSHDSDADK